MNFYQGDLCIMKKFFVSFLVLALPLLSYAHSPLTLEERVARLERIPTPPLLCVAKKGMAFI